MNLWNYTKFIVKKGIKMAQCMRCNEPETRKISSRKKTDGIFIRRRCFTCGFRFITWKPINDDGYGEEFYSEMRDHKLREDNKNRTKYF